MRKKFDGYSVDGRLSILSAGKEYLGAREERGQFPNLALGE
jgi:hypothetical protein